MNKHARKSRTLNNYCGPTNESSSCLSFELDSIILPGSQNQYVEYVEVAKTEAVRWYH